MAHLPIPNDISNELVRASHKLYARGLVANHDGNITVRLYDGFFAATPTSFSKADVTKEDLLIVDAQGQVVAGRHRVFSEISWHLALYRARPDISCVVHGHPIMASAYALAGRELGTPAIAEAVVSLGKRIGSSVFFSPLDTAAFTVGGAFECAARDLLAESDGFLVPGNGAWAVGQNIMQSYYRLELIEHLAQQHSAAEKLGELRRLPADLVAALLARRPKTCVASSNSAILNSTLLDPVGAAGPAMLLPALKHVLPPAASENAASVGLTPADLKEIVRAELEQFLR